MTASGDDEDHESTAQARPEATAASEPVTAAPSPSASAREKPKTTRCDAVDLPSRDTEFDTVHDAEQGIIQVYFTVSGKNREFAIDYRRDETCKQNGRVKALIEHVLETSASG